MAVEWAMMAVLPWKDSLTRSSNGIKNIYFEEKKGSIIDRYIFFVEKAFKWLSTNTQQNKIIKNVQKTDTGHKYKLAFKINIHNIQFK